MKEEERKIKICNDDNDGIFFFNITNSIYDFGVIYNKYLNDIISKNEDIVDVECENCRCFSLLDEFYVFIIKNLKKAGLLEKNFKMYCCNCGGEDFIVED